MAERFERLYRLPDNLYSYGSPVIVAAGALLKDKQTGGVIAQLKFQSLSPVPIKALKVSLAAYDVTGKEITGVEEYQYLDLNISNGQTFGSNKAIVMPHTVTRSFAVTGITVVLTDGSAETAAMPLAALPEAVPLKDALGDSELVKQYRLAVNEKAACMPQETEDLWLCSCGQWNSCDSCTQCGAKDADVFSAYDIPELTDKMTARLANERVQRKEQERLAKMRKRKIAKTVKIMVFVAAIILVGIWYLANSFIPRKKYEAAEKLYRDGNTYQAAIDYYQISSDYDAFQRCFEIWDELTERSTIASGVNHSVGITKDSTVIATAYTGSPEYYEGQCDVANWSSIIALAAGEAHTVGLKSDGTVVAVGDNDYGQCDTSSWAGIVSISANEYHTVGLKGDGTVIATGETDDGRCQVSSWKDIVSVSAGYYHTVGLKNDGTVIATEFTGPENWYYGQCETSDWSNIVQVSAGREHTVGLKTDGTVVAVGDNRFGQCDVSEWENIVYISAGSFHTVGLKSDGTVISTNVYNYKFDYDYGQDRVSEWENVISVSAGRTHTLGLLSDGTVISTAYTGTKDAWDSYDGQCDVSDWTDIRVPNL